MKLEPTTSVRPPRGTIRVEKVVKESTKNETNLFELIKEDMKQDREK